MNSHEKGLQQVNDILGKKGVTALESLKKISPDKDIIELLIFLIGYVGFPTSVNALIVAQEVFDSL